MKKYIYILIIVSWLPTLCFSQSQKEAVKPSSSKNAVFAEFLGNGFLYSLNYERLFKGTFTLRTGISYLSEEVFMLGDMLTFPISSSMLFSLTEISHIETGIAYTIQVKGQPLESHFTPVVGYRIQNISEGGGYFRLSFTPFVEYDNKLFIEPWGGISFGASF